jgi:hypothetical protein
MDASILEPRMLNDSVSYSTYSESERDKIQESIAKSHSPYDRLTKASSQQVERTSDLLLCSRVSYRASSSVA